MWTDNFNHLSGTDKQQRPLQCWKLRLIGLSWKSFCVLLMFNLFSSNFARALGNMGYWWNMGLLSWKAIHQSPAYLLASKSVCLRVEGLTHSQAHLCQRYFDHMPVVGVGAKLGIHECQNQFRFRHWNCSSSSDSSAFGPITHTGSREAGFAHAISAAGVVHALARGCKEARLFSCGCSKADRPEQLHRDWIWGGCGDNIAYAYRFAKTFIDVREKEQSYPRHSPELSRMLMNLHNNRAGRLAIYKMASVSCKCHGVSASCSLRTCWTQLSPFPRVGRYLRHVYDEAIKVKFNRRGTKLRRFDRHQRRVTPDHLTYLEDSPDHCKVVTHLESGGNDSSVKLVHRTRTTGRECIPYGAEEINCNELCCRRGSRVAFRKVEEKCNCQFFWCCRLECQTCVRMEKYHVCN